MIKTHTEREVLNPTNLSGSRARDGVSENAPSIPATNSPDDGRRDSGNEVANSSPIAPPARPSRRGFLMNTIVSAASLASAAAIPSPSVAKASDINQAAATLARCEQVVDTLRTKFICQGWTMDEAGAQRALSYFRNPVVTGPGEDDDYAYWEAEAFLRDHGQSLDWVLDGDLGGMICRLAAHSRRAAAVATVDSIFAAIEAHRCAYAEFEKANEAPSRIVGKHHRARVHIGDYAENNIVCSKTDDGGITITTTPTDKKSPRYAYDAADIERNVPRDLQGDDRGAWVKQRLAELKKDVSRIAKNHARTKLGKLEAIRDAAYGRERDTMWDLIWTVPTTMNGLAALLRYCRENGSINHLVYNDEWEEALEWTMERAVCACAGLPEPLMNDVVASLWNEGEGDETAEDAA